MKRNAQAGIGLVILGVVAIIAVIGLVLLFTRASAEGAAIGDVYGGGAAPGNEKGIGTPLPTPQYYQTQGGGVPAHPEVAYPAYAQYPTAVSTKGSRTPAFIVSSRLSDGTRAGYATLEQAYACEWDLIDAGIPVPHNQFNLYQVPSKAGGGAVGGYPPSSASEPRPPRGYTGTTGGDVYAYASSVGAEGQVPNSEDLIRENILAHLVDGQRGAADHDWGTITVNGKRVPVCWISRETFPFPQ